MSKNKYDKTWPARKVDWWAKTEDGQISNSASWTAAQFPYLNNTALQNGAKLAQFEDDASRIAKENGHKNVIVIGRDSLVTRVRCRTCEDSVRLFLKGFGVYERDKVEGSLLTNACAPKLPPRTRPYRA